MTISENINDLEKGKFLDASGLPAVRVALSGALSPESYDEIQATYPTTSSEVYTYKNASVTVATLTVTYQDSTKEKITSVVRS